MKTEIRTKKLAASATDNDLDVDIEIRLVQARFADADQISPSSNPVRVTAGNVGPASRGAKPRS